MGANARHKTSGSQTKGSLITAQHSVCAVVSWAPSPWGTTWCDPRWMPHTQRFRLKLWDIKLGELTIWQQAVSKPVLWPRERPNFMLQYCLLQTQLLRNGPGEKAGRALYSWHIQYDIGYERFTETVIMLTHWVHCLCDTKHVYVSGKILSKVLLKNGINYWETTQVLEWMLLPQKKSTPNIVFDGFQMKWWASHVALVVKNPPAKARD